MSEVAMPEHARLVPIMKAVYFVQRDGVDGLIKIGRTRQGLKARLQTLRCEVRRAGPDALLTPLLVVPGDRVTESRFHRQFASFREHGEWFRPVPELLSFIETIRSERGDGLATICETWQEKARAAGWAPAMSKRPDHECMVVPKHLVAEVERLIVKDAKKAVRT